MPPASEPPEEPQTRAAPVATPVIVHLSGRLRGATRRLRGASLTVGLGAEADVPLRSDEVVLRPEEPRGAAIVARLQRRGATYRVIATGATELWVNGERVTEITLASGDVLELGPGGPLLRFRLYPPGSRAYKTVGEAFSDCVDCARLSGAGRTRRTGILVGGAARELLTQTAPWVRIATAALLVVLLAALAGLWTRNLRLERRVEAQTVSIRGLSEHLRRTETTLLSPDDAARLRARLEQRIAANLERLQALEGARDARLRAIATSSDSVAFLQGAYGFDDPETGRALRYLGPGPGGGPRRGPDGTPLLTFEGDGPVVEILYTGTGFVVSPDGLMLSNRHVVLPWEFDDSIRGILAQGLAPRMRRFVGYLPGHVDAFPVELVRASDHADVALLRAGAELGRVRALPLSGRVPSAGDEVVVLGYPTGIQALIVRADPVLVETLMHEDRDFWEVAAALSRAGYIAPLATMGIVGQVTGSSVVYDAVTTHGGSGGPVIDLDGQVVAVNTAIIAEFGGSNLGVPIAEVRRLLDMPATLD